MLPAQSQICIFRSCRSEAEGNAKAETKAEALACVRVVLRIALTATLRGTRSGAFPQPPGGHKNKAAFWINIPMVALD